MGPTTKGSPVKLRSRAVTVAVAGAVALLVPTAAHAATRVVSMGEPGKTVTKFENKLGSDVNDFFPHGVTIHKGDSVQFIAGGFHIVDFPKHGGSVQPLVLPTGQSVA